MRGFISATGGARQPANGSCAGMSGSRHTGSRRSAPPMTPLMPTTMRAGAFLTFAQAQAIARSRFVERKRVAAGLPAQAGPYRVRDCIAEYLTWLEQNRKTAKDARWRAEALILPRLGNVECAKLTTPQLRAWRDAVANEAPRLRTKKGKAQKHRDPSREDDPDDARRRRQASANWR